MARKRRSEANEAQKFGWILPAILLALAGLFYWRDHPTRAAVVAAIAVLVVLIAQLLPGIWIRFFRVWMKFAEALSWVMTRIILSVFFFLILTPIGLLMRVIGKRPMDMSWRDGAPTYWRDKPEREATLELARRQF